MKRLALVALVLASALVGGFLLRWGPSRAKEGDESPARPSLAESVLAPAEGKAGPDLESAARKPVTFVVEGSETVESPATEADAPLHEPEPSVLYHAIVVDAVTRRPIAGARAWVPGKEDADGFQVFSDTGGRIALSVSPRIGIGLGQLAAVGYGRGSFVFDLAHDAPARADELELLPAATLEVFVSDAEGRPFERREVALAWPGELVTRGNAMMSLRERARWNELTDASGLARFEQLPAEQALDWRVGATDEPAPRLGRLALEAGERRRLAVELGGHARLVGRVRDELGMPVAGLELHLVYAACARTAVQDEGFRAMSNEDGHYAFEELTHDDYVLGLQPGDERFVLSAAERVLVDRSMVEHDLEVVHGLFLSGRVVGTPEELKGLDSLYVSARSGDGTGHTSGKLDEGAFRIGPLAPGAYLVSGSEGTKATAVVRAEAGASDVELPVLPSHEFEVRVDGAGGEIEIAVFDLERKLGMLWSEIDGRFPVLLAPGRYALQVRTSDGRVAFHGRLVISADEPRGDVVLRLEQGARCTFFHRASSGTRSLRVKIGGEPFPIRSSGGLLDAGSEVLPGAALTVLLPPGRLEVELLETGRVAAREELVLLPGERRRIELVPR